MKIQKPDKIYDMLRDFMYNFRKYTKQYEVNENSSYDLFNELNESTIIISQEENQNKSTNVNTASSIIVVTDPYPFTFNLDFLITIMVTYSLFRPYLSSNYSSSVFREKISFVLHQNQ